MEKLIVETEPRTGLGKNFARRTRQAGRIPGVVYGSSAEPLPLTVDPRVVDKILQSDAGHNSVFTLAIKGHGKTTAMIRDWQLDPVKGRLLHVDFLRIALDTRLRVKVPIEVQGEPIGVKQQGGILEIVQREIDVECFPSDIPDQFVVEVAELAINQGVRVSDLKVDASKVRILTDPARVVVHVVAPRAVEEEKPAEEAAAVVAAPESAEPELIRKRKAEAEEEAEEAPAEGEKKK